MGSIVVTLLKMQPHYSQSSRENATASSDTSPLASYKEEPPPPPGQGTRSYAATARLLTLLKPAETLACD